MIRARLIHIALRLSHINHIFENAMQEGIAHIQLLKRPTIIQSKCKQQSDSGRFNHRAKSFLTIQSILIKTPPSYQFSLVLGYSSITMPLQLINPLTGDNILVYKRWNKGPSLLFKQRIKLRIHSSYPLRMFDSCYKLWRFLICVIKDHLKNSRLVDTYGLMESPPRLGLGTILGPLGQSLTHMGPHTKLWVRSLGTAWESVRHPRSPGLWASLHYVLLGHI